MCVAYLGYLSGEGVEIHEKIDSSIRKGGHTTFVIAGRVYVIDSDGVGSKVLHLLGIKLALARVDERVIRTGLISNT